MLILKAPGPCPKRSAGGGGGGGGKKGTKKRLWKRSGLWFIPSLLLAFCGGWDMLHWPGTIP